jgi:hypothetical protein
MRQLLGAVAFFGMLGVTLFGLLFTRTFYAVVRRLSGNAFIWDWQCLDRLAV